MNNKERFLPIGTVVLLKGGKRELMINSYCITPNGDVYEKGVKVDVKDKMYDYGACLYPDGMISSDQIFAFDHDQIERICYMGYETERYEALSRILNGGLAELKNKKIAEGQE